MSKMVKIAGLVVVAVAVVAAALVAPSLAFAQGPNGAGGPGGPGGNGPQGGMMNGGNGWMAQYRDEMHAAIANALGLSVEDFEAALASGQTVWQIAEAQGVSVETLQAAMQAAHADILAQAVADGLLTQEQADAMLAHMNARIAQGGGWGMGGGHGPMGGYNGNCPWLNDND